VRPVVVEATGIGDADAAEEAQARVPCLREDRGGLLVDAVARAYIAEFDALVDGLVRSADGGDWSDPVGRLVDEFVALYRSHPGYVALWSGRHLSPELARADEANNQLIAASVRRVLAEYAGLPDDAALELAVRVAVRAADALLQYAFAVSPDGDDAVLAELKTLLRLYLANLAPNTGP